MDPSLRSTGRATHRIAAFNAATGALISSFKTVAGSTVRALAVTSSTVYFGGDFTKVTGGATRPYVAAANRTTGAILPWSPKPNANVCALAVNPAQTSVIVGGHFNTMNGSTREGMAAVDINPNATTPAVKSWGANSVIQNSGTECGGPVPHLRQQGRVGHGLLVQR